MPIRSRTRTGCACSSTPSRRAPPPPAGGAGGGPRRHGRGRRLDPVAGGPGAMGGRVELGAAERAALPPAVVARRGAEARARLARVRADAPAGVPAEHHQFSGASLALTAATYAAI